MTDETSKRKIVLIGGTVRKCCSRFKRSFIDYYRGINKVIVDGEMGRVEAVPLSVATVV